MRGHGARALGAASVQCPRPTPATWNPRALRQRGQKRRWLDPLLAGEIRSSFLTTEPGVASSDATNIECRIVRDRRHYVINGRKWFSTGAGSPRCAIYIVMGKTDPAAEKHRQQSQILVPPDTPGITVVRPLSVFGYDDAPHGHMEWCSETMRVPASTSCWARARLRDRAGTARPRAHPSLHARDRRGGTRAQYMCKRALTVAFGRPLSRHGVWQQRIADSRCMIDQARLLTLRAAHLMDTVGNKAARAEIAMIKGRGAAGREPGGRLGDPGSRCGGVSQDFEFASMYARARTLHRRRPRRVHRAAIAKLELARYQQDTPQAPAERCAHRAERCPIRTAPCGAHASASWAAGDVARSVERAPVDMLPDRREAEMKARYTCHASPADAPLLRSCAAR